MKHARLVAWILMLALASPLAAAPAQSTVSLAGIARYANNSPLPGAVLQVRSIDTGQIVATGTSGPDGTYSFSGLPAGNYVVEIVENNKVAGVSPTLKVGTQNVAGWDVWLQAGRKGIAGFFTSTPGLLLALAAAGGITAGVIAAGGTASPSR